jgi:uncharacterized protein YodC (DUF2158 family)
MADEINVGDIVRLNSADVKMTVRKLQDSEGRTLAVCDWFDGTTNKTASFPVSSLTRLSI